uniref:Pyruvate kinase C-terminal domain-containing protein n=1 Tax=Octactis speculum TaxID=3111310 RepID=A0A7S2MRG2_9STRA|mmetsp:Transcript_8726/g.11067  ORF Transcript_8726/g.11067 Transcript_8726/m.11067 type:complete len:172 (+) Transcript_8726:204-719(+)|eukprot:CAMPEP_0185758288 /NCGR_PEP_ID=MMETSP1174-20130828/16913_1 /TAXON_ID=35687 /ORGANISM="Dictyocha speculum, Strain CCMP1381" /LENGTH=171 /DNA_ID=CAMNT_0028438075 /DNA_START=71 /DNA_END=586 /DNA_ORIENTATION=+
MRAITSEADSLKAQFSHADVVTSYQNQGNPLDLDRQSLESVASAAIRTASDLKAKIIICITEEGSTARAIAKMRPNMPVLTFCGSAAVARQLQFHRALYPMLMPDWSIEENWAHITSKRSGEIRAEALRTAQEAGWVKAGDQVVIMDTKQGSSTGKHQFRTNLLVLTIGQD